MKVGRVLAVGAMLVCCVSSAQAEDPHAVPRSALALNVLSESSRPDLIFAERVIEREWTTPQDSGVVHIQGERSEIGMLALSAAVPGAGQMALGERRGLWFALAEAVGWLGWWSFHRNADDLRDEARSFVGSPEDSSSAWSFERWSDATAKDAGSLRALYAADPEAFYDAIDNDPQYAAGWTDVATQSHFNDLRTRSDRGLERARDVSAGIWINHLLAAADAFRAARVHNVPLRGGLDLKARGRFERGRPAFTLALERRFR